jgi:hypothetical protein
MIRLKISIVLLGGLLLVGCTSEEPKDVSAKQHRRTHESTSSQDDIQNDIRGGGLKDPGGARDVRQEMQDQQQQQQQELDETNQ